MVVFCCSLCLSSVEGLNHEDAITVRFPYHSGRITVGVLQRLPFQCSNIDLGESFSVLFRYSFLTYSLLWKRFNLFHTRMASLRKELVSDFKNDIH